ncbi:MAG: aldo/keto reductase [Flavobacteriaceae bacterium]|nr:aldo/keto reductase [Flavobacteriaceae bacterium]
MKYNRYIQDVPLVSEIGLGAWQLGQNSGWQGMSEKDAVELVKRSLEYGINFFDTAPNYGRGSGEDRLGKALKGVDRSKIVINTKFGHTDSRVGQIIIQIISGNHWRAVLKDYK